MAQARTSRASSGDATSIGAGARIRGRVTGDGDLVVAGSIEGDITVRGDVTIAEGASCTSNVEGHAITVSGALSGDVSASGAVTVGASAQLRGNVSGATIAIEEGAAFAGRIDCDFELPAELGSAPAAGRRR